jgi:hypothetical protein
VTGLAGLEPPRLPWQRPSVQRTQFLKPMLRGLNTVAINNLDPQPWQPRRTAAADLRNERPQHRRAVAYQRRRGVGFHAIEFIID